MACEDEEVLAATIAAVEAVAAQLVNLNVRLPTSATEQEAMAFPPGQSLVDRDDPVPELGLAPAVRIGISATQYGGVHESGVVTPRDDGVQGALTASRPEQAVAAGDSQSGEATRAEEVEAGGALTASRPEQAVAAGVSQSRHVGRAVETEEVQGLGRDGVGVAVAGGQQRERADAEAQGVFAV